MLPVAHRSVVVAVAKRRFAERRIVARGGLALRDRAPAPVVTTSVGGVTFVTYVGDDE